MRADVPAPAGPGATLTPTTPQRVTVIGLWLVLVAVCVFVLMGIRLSTDMSAFLPKNPDEQQRLIANIVGSLKKTPKAIQEKMAAHFKKADPAYGGGIANGLGLA